MGVMDVRTETDPEQLRIFTQRLLNDVRALERMLKEDMIESGVTRIGAEQELFLVDRSCRPASRSLEVLKAVDDPHFTTELARFNLEFNLDPVDWGPDCLAELENQLNTLLQKVRRAAGEAGVEVLLAGILPTLHHGDLTLENMTPFPRYFALAEAIYRRRGKEFELNIRGLDELSITHNSVMAEACNTSFQVHLQVDPGRFAPLYNIAQAVSGPLLAAAVNSPLLFGRRLWQETRIALFQEATDTRGRKSSVRQEEPRVSFGNRWVDDGVLEIFRDDITRFKVLITDEIVQDPFEQLSRGEVPRLRALCLHNGTVYRWNRPCYGISNGRPHLRIENRVLPSGPTTLDEMANAAFWFGLVRYLDLEVGDIRPRMSFDQVKENFLAAARQGLKAHFHWFQHRSIAAVELILSELLPQSRHGLEELGVGSEHIDRYLGVVEERVRSQQTGARWLLESLASMQQEGTPAERLASLTAATLTRQKEGQPVHTWPLARLREQGGWEEHYQLVRSLMSTDLFTVNEDEALDLVASLMDWRHIRHVPVEDNEHRLVGLITHRTLLRALSREHGRPQPKPISVQQIMTRDVVTVHPDTPTLEAMHLMKQQRIGCLPVLDQGRLVGILTDRDFVKISQQLLENFLLNRAPVPPSSGGA